MPRLGVVGVFLVCFACLGAGDGWEFYERGEGGALLENREIIN